jgi:hypothetical protein
LLVHALQPLLRFSPGAFSDLVYNTNGTVMSVLHLALTAMISNAELSSDTSKWLIQSLLKPPAAVSSDNDIERWSVNEGALTYRYLLPSRSQSISGSKGGLLQGDFKQFSATTRVAEFAKELANSSDRFASLRLYTSSYAGVSATRKKVPVLDDIKAVYEKVNPIELAAEDPSFIDRVLRLAHEQKLDEWAAFQGLILLVAMSPDKFGKLDDKRVEFVFRAAARDPAQMRLSVVHALRTRYNEAKSRRQTPADKH